MVIVKSAPTRHLGGELLITTLKNKFGDVVVAMRDSSKEVDAKDAERIFEPFFATKTAGMVWDYPSAEGSSKTITAHFGLNQTRTEELPFSLPFHRAAG